MSWNLDKDWIISVDCFRQYGIMTATSSVHTGGRTSLRSSPAFIIVSFELSMARIGFAVFFPDAHCIGGHSSVLHPAKYLNSCMSSVLFLWPLLDFASNICRYRRV